MKKLIVLSVVFALVAGVAFAVDLSGSVIGTFYVMQGDSVDDSPVYAGGEFKHVRIEGAGEAGEGKFGGWLRIDPIGDGTSKNLAGLGAGIAWWKPIDQFKLSIGGNPDRIWGKEGYSGWMFNQQVSDTGVVSPSNAWGGGYVQWPYRMRLPFFGGFDDDRLFMTISPLEMVDINIGIPFTAGNGEAKYVFASTIAQVDLKLAFGNIAFTYQGAVGKGDIDKGVEEKQPIIYGFFDLTSIENLSLAIGFNYQFDNDDGSSNPMGVGFALKYDLGSFGFKLRGLVGFQKDDIGLLFEALPYYALSDSLKIFAAIGLNTTIPEVGDSTTGWHINPYVEVGSDWGPKFFAGIRLESDGVEQASNDNKAIVKFSIPIALSVSF